MSVDDRLEYARVMNYLGVRCRVKMMISPVHSQSAVHVYTCIYSILLQLNDNMVYYRVSGNYGRRTVTLTLVYFGVMMPATAVDST